MKIDEIIKDKIFEFINTSINKDPKFLYLGHKEHILLESWFFNLYGIDSIDNPRNRFMGLKILKVNREKHIGVS